MRRTMMLPWLFAWAVMFQAAGLPAAAQEHTCEIKTYRDPRNPAKAGWILKEEMGTHLIVHVGNLYDDVQRAVYIRCHGERAWNALGFSRWMGLGRSWQETYAAAQEACREWRSRRASIRVEEPEPKPRPRADAPADDCGKGAALTRYLSDLSAHHRAISYLDEELGSLLGRSDLETPAVVEVGRRAQRLVADYHRTLKEFRRAETRRGLLDELELLVDTPILINQVIVKYQKLAKSPVKPLTPEDLVRARGQTGSPVLALIRNQLASRLESEGLRDILTSDSWTEAVETATFHARRKVDEYLDRETENILGIGFHDAESAARALRMQMRREIRRQVARLLVKVTSNEIIIELAAGPIIRWLERDLIPRLREALRQKGDLTNRVSRSIETQEAVRDSLNALACDARLSEVRRRLASAQGTIRATHFLDKDLRNAYAAGDLSRLSDALGRLERTIHLTQTRFLLLKDDYEEDLPFIDELIGQLAGILERSIPAESTARRTPPYPVEPVPDTPAPVRRLRYEAAAGIPSLRATLTALRFFEGGDEGVPVDRRQYGTSFSTSSSRFVYWELSLAHPAPGRRVDFTIESIYYAPDGSVIGRADLSTYLEGHWLDSSHCYARGWVEPGHWLPGTYRVEFFVFGERIAVAEFEIQSP